MIEYARLLKLAKHLESGKLGHEEFNFAQFNNAKEPKCGTAGCAIGECPIAFPNDWEFRAGQSVALIGSKIRLYTSESHGAKKFFGLTHHQADHLFYPEMQDTKLYGGKYLEDDATRHEVASNIRIFVKTMKARARSRKK